MSEDVKKNEYSQTLNLPKTEFSLRAQFEQTDQAMLERWGKEKLSEQTFIHNQGKEKFILHDGPPYANGHIHLGHAYNKILKDIVAKSERMSGKHVPVIPGWDCHGLPIELKVVQEKKYDTRASLQQACRAYASHWIETQKSEFKKLGVMMHWQKPYLTMDYAYEASIVRAFAEFFKQGFIQKKLKTIPWCASCQTVLANAEIEYAERKDPSLYVLFTLQNLDTQKLFPTIQNQNISLLVWTTTPWTIPLNRAVIVHPDAAYALVDVEGVLVIMGAALVEKFKVASGKQATVLETFHVKKLFDSFVHHPLEASRLVPILSDDFVSLEDGTACVHSAPGCGPEDYEIGLKYGLEIYSPISADGKYTTDIEPKALVGMPVSDGQIWVIKELAQLNKILFKTSLRHSYPHCWRCHQGLIFRATSQWFCDLTQHNLKNRALESIETLRMIPATGSNRFSATLQGRLEWCLSRQRTWGVPIPALNCLTCNHVFTSLSLIELVACGIEKSGIEFWDHVSISDLGSITCPTCQSTELKKEFDILDVWFESGVSHYAVLFGNREQAFPADMYLEGKDQHRAWFQSSLLTGLVLEKTAPFKEIVTHGFTVDAQGRKMSKSLGNVVTPDEIIKKVGTDGLRLWVASNDYDSDPVVSDLLLKNVSEVYRKVRNTCRFLLSNLYDFNADMVPVDQLYAIDQYAMIKLDEFNKTMQRAYADRKTVAAFSLLADFCSKELSSFYLDIIKDRLYVHAANSHERRCAQTVCSYILHTLNTAMAPILSFTAEQVFDHYKKQDQGSIHVQGFVDTAALIAPLDTVAITAQFSSLLTLRTQVLSALEGARAQGLIGHSLDACVQVPHVLVVAPYQSVEDFLKEIFIVSQVTLHAEQQIKVAHAQGGKCPRCWQWHVHVDADGLCLRCGDILKK